MGKLRALGLALPLCLFCAGCAEQGMVESVQGVMSERSAFQNAKASGASQDWQAFISNYPNSSRIPEANQELNAAYWREVQAQDTAGPYLAFLDAHPGHPNAGDARGRARSALLEGKGEEADYAKYLSAFPDDEQSSELRQALAKARLAATRKSGEADDIALYIASYPGTQAAASLKPKQEANEYQKAKKLGTRLAYRWFLKNFPNSANAAGAKENLEETAPTYKTAAEDPGQEIARLREGSAAFRTFECRRILVRALARESSVFGARAESLRGELTAVFKSGAISATCSEASLAVAPSEKQTALRALGALSELAGQRSRLTSLAGDPDELAASAEELSQTALAFADDAEGKEQEEDALYGRGSENPDDAKDTASVNAREAVKRAHAAAGIASSLKGHSDAQGLLKNIDAQGELLLKILAATEEQAAKASNDSNE